MWKYLADFIEDVFEGVFWTIEHLIKLGCALLLFVAGIAVVLYVLYLILL